MMNRRSFLTACIATMTAPAIVRASSLMPVSVRRLPFAFGAIDLGTRWIVQGSENDPLGQRGYVGTARCAEYTDITVNLHEYWLASLPALQVDIGAPTPHRVKV
jgi:hypothetical protein